MVIFHMLPSWPQSIVSNEIVEVHFEVQMLTNIDHRGAPFRAAGGHFKAQVQSNWTCRGAQTKLQVEFPKYKFENAQERRSL